MCTSGTLAGARGFATVYWVDVFVRIKYFECITKNLNYCVDNKGMEIYAWCIMPSHIHFVFKSTIQKPEELLRDFKSFTSKDMLFAQAGRLRERGLQRLMRHFHYRLAKWVLNKYKDLKGSLKKAHQWIEEIRVSYPTMFYHWTIFKHI